MAFAATVQWNVRNGGNAANGGGFDPTSGTPGTNYSLQDSPQITFTDLVIDAVTNTDCTSAGNPFTAAHVGNIVNITSGTGFTVQRVQIMSVTAGVATMDKSLGTLGSTGGNGRLGGAFATPGEAGAVMVAGNYIHLQRHATDFSATSTSSNVANGRLTVVAGAIATPSCVRGYETTPFDDTGVRPTFKWGVNAGSNYIVTLANTYQNIENIILDGNRANFTNPAAVSMGSAFNRFRRVKFMGFTATLIGFFNECTLLDCEFTNNTVVLAVSSSDSSFDTCYWHDNTVGAMTVSSATMKIANSIFDTNGAAGISSTAASSLDISNCIFYNMTGPGVDFTAAPSWARFTNCIFVGNSTYGIALAGAYQNVFLDNCAFYNNTSGEFTSGNIFSGNIRNKITLTADPFVDAANGDFRLNMKTGGGALLRGAGYPQTFPGTSYAHRRDIGAHQHSGPKRGING